MEYGREVEPLGERRLALPTLLFATLGPPVAWVLHLSVSYFLVAFGCTTGWRGTVASVAVATLIFAALAAWAGLVAFRGWRRVRTEEALLLAIDEAQGRAAFLMVLGILGAALFTFLIVLNGLPPLLVPTCS